jgi:hypothetical protein
MMMPATTAPENGIQPAQDNHRKTVMPKACRVSKLSPVILPMMPPAAAALSPAVAQASPNTRGTEMPTDMEANWSSDTARMEMPTVDFLKNQENPRS